MASYISFQPSDYFNPVGYTGTASGAKVVTGVGFQPDNIFFKLRSGVYSWAAIDAVRGVTKILECDADGAEGANLNYLASFDSDGFSTTATQDTGTNSSGTYMGFSWKAGTTSGLPGGTITPSAYSFNATSGFGMYKFTGTGANANIAHGLGKTPKFIIIKNLTDADDWTCYHVGAGNNAFMVMNTTAAEGSGSTLWNDTTPTSTLFYLGANGKTNASGAQMMAYVFAEIKGYSKFGSYYGYDNDDGPFIYTGFRPAMVVIKRSAAGAWWTNNSTVNPINITTLSAVKLNSTAAETTDSSESIDVVSNGFKLRQNGGDINYSGEYYYMAFAEFPIVSSNDMPGVAR